MYHAKNVASDKFKRNLRLISKYTIMQLLLKLIMKYLDAWHPLITGYILALP